MTQTRPALSVKQQQSFVHTTGEDHRQSDKDVGGLTGLGQTLRLQPQKCSRSPFKVKNTCGWCGRSPIFLKVLCPSNNVTCHRCSKLSHFQSSYRSVKVSELLIESPLEEEVTFLGALTKGSPRDHDNSWTA